MSAAQRSAAFVRREAMKNHLAQGVSPDAVGEMVLAAVRENRLYVRTCPSSADPIAARGKARMGAMPPVAARGG